MAVSSGWGHGYRTSNRNGPRRERGGETKGQAADTFPWGYGKVNSAKTGPTSADSHQHVSHSPNGRKKQDWEAQYILAGSQGMPVGDSTGAYDENTAGQNTNIWPTEFSYRPWPRPEPGLPGAYPEAGDTQAGHRHATTWNGYPSPPQSSRPPTRSCSPALSMSATLHSPFDPEGESGDDPETSRLDIDTSDIDTVRLGTPVSPISTSHRSTKNHQPSSSDPPSPTKPPGQNASTPLSLALRDTYQALQAAHGLFSTYVAVFEARVGRAVLGLARPAPLDLMWRDMAASRFGRGPDRRRFEAARDGLAARAGALRAALVLAAAAGRPEGEGRADGYVLERRARAARKALALVREIGPLVGRARGERMGCMFLVEEVAGLMGLLDPETHPELYVEDEERGWGGGDGDEEVEDAGGRSDGERKEKTRQKTEKEETRQETEKQKKGGEEVRSGRGRREKGTRGDGGLEETAKEQSDTRWGDQDAPDGSAQEESSGQEDGWDDDQHEGWDNNGDKPEQSGWGDRQDGGALPKTSSDDANHYGTPDCSGHARCISDTRSEKDGGNSGSPLGDGRTSW